MKSVSKLWKTALSIIFLVFIGWQSVYTHHVTSIWNTILCQHNIVVYKIYCSSIFYSFCIPILLLTWKMGRFKQNVLSSKLCIRSKFKYQEIKAEKLISCLIFIFWCQTQMFSLYSSGYFKIRMWWHWWWCYHNSRN